MKFSSKAKTLKQLRKVLRTAYIAPLYSFKLKQWFRNRENCVKSIHSKLGSGPWIVRSSSTQEDTSTRSNAGAFLSLLNVTEASIIESIKRVIGSYGKAYDSDEVLIQPMLKNVVYSGVAFSHDPKTCSPYRIINYYEGADTTAVTGGAGGKVWQHAGKNISKAPPFIQPVIRLIGELLDIFDGIPIDCEFAITSHGGENKIWLLQARPLILDKIPESEDSQLNRLQKIYKKIEKGMEPHPFLTGQNTVFGVMPDWNPAEIIGIRPKPLALSLYRELITDSIWAYQRHNYGYRNLRSFPLMQHFYGLPYIDVRLSFNSFIPADLDEKLAGKLVDYYIEELLAKPTLHDKIEFEIVNSCYSFDLSSRLDSLTSRGFTKKEVNSILCSLRQITNNLLDPEKSLWRFDARKLKILTAHRNKLLNSDKDLVDRIYWLLEDTKRYGTLPFAGLARAGFIGMQILRSIVNVGIFTASDYEKFVESISTVTTQMAQDRHKLDKAQFISRYGHLRPGTYDIVALRYDEAPDHYFNWNDKSSLPKKKMVFDLPAEKSRVLNEVLLENKLHTTPFRLLKFIKDSIRLRELSKFKFTRNLSDALVLISELGAQLGLSKEDMSFCDVSVFQELFVGAGDCVDLIHRSIDKGKAQYSQTLKVSLPPLISSPEQVFSFEIPEARPNFITHKQLSGKVVSCDDKNSLKDSIVCIPNADPGFDWLFSYSIGALVTAWGGVNSHMAIRAGELGLPAVIGAGELLYGRWSNSKKLYLDCIGQRVEILE